MKIDDYATDGIQGVVQLLRSLYHNPLQGEGRDQQN